MVLDTRGLDDETTEGHQHPMDNYEAMLHLGRCTWETYDMHEVM